MANVVIDNMLRVLNTVMSRQEVDVTRQRTLRVLRNRCHGDLRIERSLASSPCPSGLLDSAPLARADRRDKRIQDHRMCDQLFFAHGPLVTRRNFGTINTRKEQRSLQLKDPPLILLGLRTRRTRPDETTPCCGVQLDMAVAICGVRLCRLASVADRLADYASKFKASNVLWYATSRTARRRSCRCRLLAATQTRLIICRRAER